VQYSYLVTVTSNVVADIMHGDLHNNLVLSPIYGVTVCARCNVFVPFALSYFIYRVGPIGNNK